MSVWQGNNLQEIKRLSKLMPIAFKALFAHMAKSVQQALAIYGSFELHYKAFSYYDHFVLPDASDTGEVLDEALAKCEQQK